MPTATCGPTTTQSPRSGATTPSRTRFRRRRSRSSSPRCTRATSTPSANGSWPNWPRGYSILPEALARGRQRDHTRPRYSLDMRGEAGRAREDAERYVRAYPDGSAALGSNDPFENAISAPSSSVKRSALHPRYEHAKRERVLAELAPRILELAQRAKQHGIGMTIDAEEADRLELSLDVLEAAWSDPSLSGWDGLGIVVQAYLKRAPFVIDWIADQIGRAHV